METPDTDPAVMDVIRMHGDVIGELRELVKRLELRVSELERPPRGKATNITTAARKKAPRSDAPTSPNAT
jgi:hypothetical protein